jgi:hypothetical protein
VTLLVSLALGLFIDLLTQPRDLSVVGEVQNGLLSQHDQGEGNEIGRVCLTIRFIRCSFFSSFYSLLSCDDDNQRIHLVVNKPQLPLGVIAHAFKWLGMPIDLDEVECTL